MIPSSHRTVSALHIIPSIIFYNDGSFVQLLVNDGSFILMILKDLKHIFSQLLEVMDYVASFVYGGMLMTNAHQMLIQADFGGWATLCLFLCLKDCTNHPLS